eukprot:TRINITY_DN3533_c0_g1_i1.p1 TRINITY_DN3533_c0_g1~~TRINITY_DN3533_c0_g1_i1.p1  ORF type:complete len:263 (+),score=116.10 TRINITY_DN3533_c0_g1_i1:42-830(+)
MASLEDLSISGDKCLKFTQPPTFDQEHDFLHLSNESSIKSIVFKIKTTNSKKYWVKPSNAIIEPKSSIQIKVTRLPDELGSLSSHFTSVCNDKFLVVFKFAETQDAKVESTDADALKHRISVVYSPKITSKPSKLSNKPSEKKETSSSSAAKKSSTLEPVKRTLREEKSSTNAPPSLNQRKSSSLTTKSLASAITKSKEIPPKPNKLIGEIKKKPVAIEEKTEKSIESSEKNESKEENPISSSVSEETSCNRGKDGEIDRIE